MYKKIALFSCLSLITAGIALQAMENREEAEQATEVLAEQQAVHPVALIKRRLQESAQALRDELCSIPQDFDHSMALQECHRQTSFLQQGIAACRDQYELDQTNINICSEMNELFELIKTQFQLIERQMLQLPVVERGNTITAARRRMLVAHLLAEEQKVQNSLHTLFNILSDRNYRLVPGKPAAEGDRVIAKQIREKLPVALFDTLWQGVLGHFSGHQACQTSPRRFIPGPTIPLMQRVKDRVATALDNTYTGAMVGSAQEKVEATNKLITGNAPTQKLQPLQDSLQQRMQWLTYDLAGRLRSYGFGHHNYMPLLIGDFAQQLGIQKDGQKALQVLADGSVPIDKTWLLRLGMSRVALFGVRRFESLMMTAVQPKPQTMLGKLKWLAAKGCRSLLCFCAGNRNLQKVQEFMIGKMHHAPSPENAVVVNYNERKKAPQLTVNNNGTLLKVFIGGTDHSTAVSIEQGPNKAVVEASKAENNMLITERGLRLNVTTQDGACSYSLEGDTHPLVQIINQEQGPAVKVLGARSRQINIEQTGSIASYIAAVRAFRQSPVQRLIGDELLYRVGAHAALIRGASRTIFNNAQSLAARQLTDMQHNVEDPDFRNTLQTMARQWHPILADQ